LFLVFLLPVASNILQHCVVGYWLIDLYLLFDRETFAADGFSVVEAAQQ